jgi:hypothetical protein
VITEIFLIRVTVVATIIFIIATPNFSEMVQNINEKINSKNKKLIKSGKRLRLLFVVVLSYLSIVLIISLINVTHQYFYKSSFIDLGKFNKSTTSDKIAKQFYRMVETGRMIREVD